jgi:hypothetical protein
MIDLDVQVAIAFVLLSLSGHNLVLDTHCFVENHRDADEFRSFAPAGGGRRQRGVDVWPSGDDMRRPREVYHHNRTSRPRLSAAATLFQSLSEMFRELKVETLPGVALASGAADELGVTS